MQGGLATLSQKVTALEAAVRQQGAYLGLETLPPPEAPAEESTPEKVPVVKPEKEEAKGSLKSKDLELYDISMAYFNQGKYEEAMDSFKDFLKRYPKSDRADNAQFWVGECYMSLKQYEQAILAYQEVIKKYPKGNKVPNALLRQAIAFLEIKDKTSSRLLLKKVIKKYPRSNEAKIAKIKLKSIK
jgi:tol-pal system protein YbgF